MYDKVSQNTNIALYADDTKIWRYINFAIDHHILQNNINALYNYKWSVENKMKFILTSVKYSPSIISVKTYSQN